MAKFGIGQSVRRVEDPRLLTGGGRYTDDTKLSAPAARALRAAVPLGFRIRSLTMLVSNMYSTLRRCPV